MNTLPLTRDLTLAYRVSLGIAGVMTIASVGGLLDGARLYPGLDAALLLLFVGQDVLNLVVGLPLLLSALWLTRRGVLLGLLLWPGALFYVLYDYGYYILGAPFNGFFLAYLALMVGSVYTLIGIVGSVDGAAVREQLAGRVPRRLIGGFLAGLGLLFMALWTAMTLAALLSGTGLAPIPHTVVILDLTVQLPALLVGGALLWRQVPLGYVVAAGLLLQAGAYLIGLSVLTLGQEILLRTPLDPTAIVPGLVVGALCLALLVFFVRGTAGRIGTRVLPAYTRSVTGRRYTRS